ncbi:hypothetical protein As57867_022201, partial [Aphanomyces stellatus]
MQRSASEGFPLEHVFLSSPSKRRIRAIVELNREVNRKVDEQAQVQQAVQRTKYLSRWKHLRALFSYYKLNALPATSATRIASPGEQHAHSPQRRKHDHGHLELACAELCVEPWVPVMVMESIMYSSLMLDARAIAAQSLVKSFLQCMHVSHPRKPGTFVDFRAICCMWDVLVNPTFPPARRLTRWFYIYAVAPPSSPREEAVVLAMDVRAMLLLSCPDVDGERDMDPFVHELLDSLDDQPLHLACLLAFAGTLLRDAHGHDAPPAPDHRFDLQVLVRRFCWDNLTEAQRVAIEKDESDLTAAIVERERMHAQHKRALAYWMLMEPRKRFQRWKHFTDDSVRLKKADAHAKWYKHRHGLCYLGRNTARVQWMKRRRADAARQYHRTLQHTALDGWVHFWTAETELARVATGQAEWQYATKRLRASYERLQTHATEQREAKKVLLARAVALLQQTTDKLLVKMVDAWRYFVQLQQRDRMAAKDQANLVAAGVEFDRCQRELRQMDYEDRYAAQIRADEEADFERARKAMFRAQAKQVYEVRKIK